MNISEILIDELTETVLTKMLWCHLATMYWAIYLSTDFTHIHQNIFIGTGKNYKRK